ncbi:unnamed protein product [Chironomus riparius]|uniref:Palmitoyltransferase n=1 Tax=Chironomus riparius TaxID=315576 RepID=A0A9N9RK93_9DIPT|nr:unnamed protein product [Chironomus riparius]
MDYDYYPLKRHVDTHNRIFRGKIWCIQDICGIICAVLTWFLIAYAEFVVMKVMLLPSPYFYYRYINMILFNCGTFLAISSHLKTMFSDPGAVQLGNATKENIQLLGLREGEIIFKCPKCSSIKPNRAHHCSVCKRCILKMDHHWLTIALAKAPKKMNFYAIFSMFCMLIISIKCYDPTDKEIETIIPKDGDFEAFYPREMSGISNSVARAPHAHGSFFQHRNPALVDIKNAAAYGFRFDESPILSTFLTTTTVPITTTQETTTTEEIPTGGGLPNNICSPYVGQYLSLSSSVRTKIFDFINANQRTSFELLGQQTKTFIESLLFNGGLSASDLISLQKFSTEEMLPGVSTIICFLAYELDKMPASG